MYSPIEKQIIESPSKSIDLINKLNNSKSPKLQNDLSLETKISAKKENIYSPPINKFNNKCVEHQKA
jgi:hypothetical protein